MGNTFFQIETLVIELLLIISLVALVVQRFKVPYTIALVVAGLLIGLLRAPLEEVMGPIQLDMTPDLILALLVPPLIFEAAFHLDITELRRNLFSILLFAVPGVILTMFIVGGIVNATTSLSLTAALTFGALIAATDPVAVITLFKTLGVPRSLNVVMEGESLLNDGTAIVVFHVMIGILLTGEFSAGESIVEFVEVVVGGLAIGIGLGFGISWLIARVDNHLIEITLTTVLAFGSFLVAERLHFSGVLAVVAAGILNGNSSSSGMSPTTRIILNNFWEYIAFLSNSFIFLLIGLEVQITDILLNWQPIFVAIVAVLVARATVVYGFGYLSSRHVTDSMPRKWLHIITWGGLRGAIGLALALSLPTTLGADRSVMITMAFGVVLFTLFVQGTTIGTLLDRLGITPKDNVQADYERAHARLLAMRASEKHLDALFEQQRISHTVWKSLKTHTSQRVSEFDADLRQLLRDHPQLAESVLKSTIEDLLLVQRAALLDMRRDGFINEDVFEELAVEIDQQLESGVLDVASLDLGEDDHPPRAPQSAS